MTSQEIKQTELHYSNTPFNELFWLKEIAYQLALLNEKQPTTVIETRTALKEAVGITLEHANRVQQPPRKGSR